MKKLLLVVGLILAVGITPCYSATEWRNGTGEDTPLGTEVVSDIDAVIYQRMTDPLDRVLSKYQTTNVVWSSTTEVIVTIGEVACSNSTGSIRKFRANTSATTVTWANIDTGAEAASTTYYVYAVADADATTFTVTFSTNSTTPTGATYYKKIGSFKNDSSSNIDRTTIYTNAYGNSVNDTTGKPKITAIYNYGTSASSYTAKDSDLKFAFGTTPSIGANSSTTITNLPFQGTGYYSVSTTLSGASSSNYLNGCQVNKTNGTQFTCTNANDEAHSYLWQAIGY